MKRLICVLLSAVMLLGTVGVYAAVEEEEKSIGFIINETFDSTFTGSSPASFKISDNFKEIVNVAQVPSAENKSLRCTVKDDAISFENRYEKIKEDIVFEFDIMFENSASGTIIIASKNNAGKEFNFFTIDSKHNLCLKTGEKVFKFAEGKFYQISFCLSTITELADIYVNHKKVANDAPIGTSNPITDVSILRLYCRGVGSVKPVFYLDNVRTYQSELPIFKYENMGIKVVAGTDTSADYVAVDAAVYEYMDESVAMYVNQAKMFSHGEVTAVDSENSMVAPFVKNGRTLVPIRAVADGFDAYTTWNEAEQKVSINYEDTDISLSVGSNVMVINSEEHIIDVPAEIVSGRVFVPLRAVTEAFGKKVTYDKSGLIVVADRENFFNYRDDLPVFRALAGMLVFHQPAGTEMVNIIRQRYPNGAHPRILVNSDDVVRLRSEVLTDPDKAKWYKDVINGANALMRKDLLEYKLTPSQGVYAIPSDEAANVLYGLASAYLYSGDEVYAERCLQEMLSIAQWPDWNHRYTFLATATIMGALATAYDWLYDYISPSDREIIKNAIVEKGLVQVMEDYQNKPRQRTYSWAQSPVPDNWNIVCNSGAITAAIAIADEESELCANVFQYGMKHVQQAVLMYGPDGAWYEGPNYWGYTTRFYTRFVAALDSAFDDTFGYMDTPGVAQTGYYITAMNGPGGTFNFHDAELSRTNSSEIFFLADKLQDAGLNQFRLNQERNSSTTGNWMDIMWYNISLTGEQAQLSKDGYYRDTEVASMRSSYNDAGAVYTALHSGKIAVYHGQMDMGQFIIDGFGTRFACDLGLENYNTPGDNVTKYRYRAEGHNTLVINPDASGGQNRKGAGIIDRFESGGSSALAITDMTSAYPEYATKVKRGLKLTNNRTAVIVQDEVHLKEPSDLWWFMHSSRKIEVSEDGKSAIVYGENRNMKVSLMQETEGTFSVMAANPMPSSPTNDAQNKNLLYSKLAFHAENVKDITIPVLFEFVLPHESFDKETGYHPEVVALDKWELDETGVTEMPALSSITLNGVQISGFAKDTLSYTCRLAADEPIPQIRAEGNGKIDIEITDTIPGYAYITVTSNEDEHLKTIYVIRLLREILQTAPEGSKQLSIFGVTASETSEIATPEMALDGDLNTYWTAEGRGHITFDLGSEKTVDYVGLAVWQDKSRDGRRQYFDVLVSNDGENFTQIFSGETTGTILEEEIFAVPSTKARYVRIFGNGSSRNAWNSMTEIRIYGN